MTIYEDLQYVLGVHLYWDPYTEAFLLGSPVYVPGVRRWERTRGGVQKAKGA